MCSKAYTGKGAEGCAATYRTRKQLAGAIQDDFAGAVCMRGTVAVICADRENLIRVERNIKSWHKTPLKMLILYLL